MCVGCYYKMPCIYSNYNSSSVSGFAKLKKILEITLDVLNSIHFFWDSWNFVNFAKPPMSEVECEDDF